MNVSDGHTEPPVVQGISVSTRGGGGGCHTCFASATCSVFPDRCSLAIDCTSPWFSVEPICKRERKREGSKATVLGEFDTAPRHPPVMRATATDRGSSPRKPAFTVASVAPRMQHCSSFTKPRRLHHRRRRIYNSRISDDFDLNLSLAKCMLAKCLVQQLGR